jgi:hypothetical protein
VELVEHGFFAVVREEFEPSPFWQLDKKNSSRGVFVFSALVRFCPLPLSSVIRATCQTRIAIFGPSSFLESTLLLLFLGRFSLGVFTIHLVLVVVGQISLVPVWQS